MTAAEQQEINRRRDRLLASIALSTGLGLILALPFALRAGAEFFLPLTAALVIAIALVPLLEWMERRGLPSGLAALLAVIGFLVVANTALVLIVVPATDWFSALPQRLPQIQANLAPVIDFYANLQRFVDETVQMLATGPVAAAQTAAVEAPRSLLQFAAVFPDARERHCKLTRGNGQRQDEAQTGRQCDRREQAVAPPINLLLFRRRHARFSSLFHLFDVRCPFPRVNLQCRSRASGKTAA